METGDTPNCHCSRRVGTQMAAKKVATPQMLTLVFLAVVAITILAGFAQVAMASVWTSPTQAQMSVIESMGFAWKAGIGAILAMLGSKTL